MQLFTINCFGEEGGIVLFPVGAVGGLPVMNPYSFVAWCGAPSLHCWSVPSILAVVVLLLYYCVLLYHRLHVRDWLVFHPWTGIIANKIPPQNVTNAMFPFLYRISPCLHHPTTHREEQYV